MAAYYSPFAVFCSLFFALASLLHGVLAYDPSPLQDFCIADFSSSGFVYIIHIIFLAGLIVDI